MNSDNGSINFAVDLSTTPLDAGAARANATLHGIGNTAAAQGSRIGDAFNAASGMVGMMAMGAIASIGMIGKTILDTTAKFEKFGIVLRNTLGDSAGNDALAMISNFAATTPFQLDEVTGAFIKLANQGFVPTYEQMTKLGDLASSTGKSFDQLGEALLDAQTGQFERLKEFGIKASANGDRVTFSFKEQKTTVENTNSAIQKYILSLGEMKGVAGANALISASLTGQMSNLGDKLAFMYNEIGNSNKGMLYSVVGGASTLIENYKAIGDVITELVLIYGAYKVSVMYFAYAEGVRMAATTAATATVVKNAAIETAVEAQLAAIRVTSASAATALAANTVAMAEMRVAATAQVIAAEDALQTSTAATSKASLANPYVLAAMAVVALGYAIYKVITYQNDLEKALSKSATQIDNEKDKVSELFAELGHATKGTDEWKKAKDAILTQYGTYLTEQQKELIGTKDQGEAQKIVNAGLAENIALKVKQESIQAISVKYNPDITKGRTEIHDAIKESLGADRAYKFDQDVEPLIAKVKLAVDPVEAKKAKQELFQWLYDLGQEVSKGKSHNGGAVNYGRNLISDALGGFVEDNDAINKAFTVQEKKNAAEKKDPILTTYQAQIDAIKAKKVIAEKELASLKTMDPTKAKPAKEAEINILTAQLNNASDKASQDAINAKIETAKKELSKIISVGVDPAKAVTAQQGVIDALNKQLGDKAAEATEKKEKKTAQEKADASLKMLNADKKNALDQRTAELENQQSILSIKDDGYLKSQEQLKLNGEKEKLAGAKLVQDLIEQQQQLERDKWEQSGKKGVFSPATQTAADLTPANQKTITDQTNTSILVRTGQETKLLEDLLAKYQDYTAKKEAIDKQYNADRLALQSSPDGKGKTAAIAQLDEQWKKDTSKLSLDDFQKSIDWASIFGDLDKVSTDSLNKFRDKVKQYLSSAGGSISKEDLKDVSGAFIKLNDAISNRTPISELISGYKEYKDACNNVSEAQKELNQLQSSGGASTQDITDATEKLTDAQKKRRDSLSDLNKSVNAVGDAGGKLVNSGKEIVDMLSNLGVNLGEGVTKTLDGIGQTMDGLSSIDITKPFTLVTGIIKTFAGVGNTIAGIFGDGAHALSQATIDYYDDLMATMKDVIAVHKDLIKELSGAAAVSESEKTIELINKQIEATRNLGKEYLASNDAHSHSFGHQLQVALTDYKDKIKSITGADLNTTSILDFSPEQLQKIKEEVPEAWAKINDQTRGYLQTIIDSGKELDDATKLLGESLTDLSFDSAKDSLKSLLLSADTTMADIADNFEEYMRNAIVNALIDGELAPLMKQWYVNFTKAMGEGSAGEGTGILTEKEKADLKKEYETIAQKGIDGRNAAYAAAGIDLTPSSATAMSGKVSAAITEDTASELVGLWNRTALDIRETLNLSRTSSVTLLSIAANTLRTADNTESLKEMRVSLKSIDSAVNKTASRG